MSDLKTICAVANRAEPFNLPTGRMTLIMYINNACEQFGFDASLLLNADDETFAHDVRGIVGNMDRSSHPGTVGNCFVPRVAR